MWRTHCVLLSGLRGEPGLLTWSWAIFSNLQWQERKLGVSLFFFPREDGAWLTCWGWRDCVLLRPLPHTGKGIEAWMAALDKTVPFPACHHPCERGSLYATTSHDTWLSSSAFTPAWLRMISSDWTLDLSRRIWRLARQLSWHRLAQKR